MQIRRIYDAEKIRQYCKEDYQSMNDDGCPPWENWLPAVKDLDKHFIEVTESGRFVSLCMFYKTTHTLAECHLLVCQKYRGKNLTKYFNRVHEFLLKETSIRNLITFLPLSRNYIIKFSLKYGWKEKCILKNSFQKNGKIEDCKLLELEL